MRPRHSTAIFFLFCFSALFAGETRVSTMGYYTEILPDDDANIDLFPQRVNDWNIVRFENIQGGSPRYLFTIGESGDKWAFYGGSSTTNDFLNVYRSLSATSAVSVGVRFSTYSGTVTDDNNEPSLDNEKDEYSNKYSNIDLNLIYGMDQGEREVAAFLQYASGPDLIGAAPFPGPHGTLEITQTVGSTAFTSKGSASSSIIGAGGWFREKRQIALFENLYAGAFFYRTARASEYKSGSTDLEDEVFSSLSFGAIVLLFNNTALTENTTLVYGLGGLFFYSSLMDEDKLSSQEWTDTQSDLGLAAPIMSAGLETSLKYGKFRFGFNRGIDLFSSSKETEEYDDGTAKNKDEEAESGIGRNGYYSFASGFGLNIGNLQIDVMLNNTFWITGPQMIFDNKAGDIGLMTDVSYTF